MIYKKNAKLGDNQEIQVEEKKWWPLKLVEVKLSFDVQFVHNLAHNWLNVGQLMANGYSFKFNNDKGIKEKQSGQVIVNVQMTKNKTFPLQVSTVKDFALVVGEQKLAKVVVSLYLDT